MIIAAGGASAPDALSTFIEEVEGSVSRLKKSLAENPLPCGSRALAFAVEAGLPPQMSYTLTQTALYTGIDRQTLDRERKAGRLRVVLPEGCERGARIRVDEVDRWMNRT